MSNFDNTFDALCVDTWGMRQHAGIHRRKVRVDSMGHMQYVLRVMPYMKPRARNKTAQLLIYFDRERSTSRYYNYAFGTSVTHSGRWQAMLYAASGFDHATHKWGAHDTPEFPADKFRTLDFLALSAGLLEVYRRYSWKWKHQGH